MNAEEQTDKMARLVSEEVLRTIFGDDLAGCPVTLDQIAAIVQHGMQQRAEADRKIAQTYETVVASLHQLATPPAPGQVGNTDELRTLLGQRLDAIHTLTSKMLEMIAQIKAQESEG